MRSHIPLAVLCLSTACSEAPQTDTSSVFTDPALPHAYYTFTGENAHNYAGDSVSSAGDVDGDGLDDLLVGAPYNDDGGNAAGKAYLFLGKSLSGTSSLSLADADYTFTGENEGDYAAYSVASAGDVDGDGKADLLVGVAGNDDRGDGAGKAYLILGGALDL